MKVSFKAAVAAGALVLGLATTAGAAPITYFGENTSPGATVSGAPVTAQSSFLSTLTGVGIADFETGALPNVTFPGSSGSITATLTGSGVSINSSPGFGRFATSGSRYVETDSGGDFSMTFSSAISAFGFYGTDIGDFGNRLILRLTRLGGGTVDLDVGNTVGSGGSPNGALLFFGFIDIVDSYTSIAFLNVPGSSDVFGFDDMIIGDRQQITDPPSEVPLPAGLPLLLAGLGAIGALRMRRKA